jgi:hypothetical protein
MGSRLRRCVAACIAVNCLAFAGCVYLPYCLPEIDRVGAVQMPSAAEEVHVFRVDG